MTGQDGDNRGDAGEQDAGAREAEQRPASERPPVSGDDTLAAIPPTPGPPTVGPPTVGPPTPGPLAPPIAGPSGTAMLPPVPDEPPGPPRPGQPGPGQPRWAGRAQVPTPQVEEDYHEAWVEQPRSLLIPILVTICVMLLLGVLGLAAWLILNNRPGQPGPTATPSATAPTTLTTGPTPTPSVAPSAVTIPGVAGDTYEVAAGKLEALGLVPHQLQQHADAPAGTVIGTDPAEGEMVPPNSLVGIIVSLGPEPTPTPSPTPDGEQT